MRIVFSWPCDPHDYPHKQTYSHAQISHHVFKALRENFEHVVFAPQGQGFPLQDEDLLISNMHGPTAFHPKRIILEADNFENDKWLYARFKKFGMDHPTDEVFSLNGHLQGALGIIMMSNDVALRRWHTNDPCVRVKKQFLVQASPWVHVMPHPIDKEYFGKFYRPDARYERARMLIYDEGERKNAVELVTMLERLGFKRGEDFETTKWFNKTESTTRQILDMCMLFGHVSISEGFPYLANEFMCGGMMLFGNAEWWDGQGDRRFTWTYDPARQEENEAALRFFFDPKNLNELHIHRKMQRQSHMLRTDNDWRCLTDALVERVKNCV